MTYILTARQRQILALKASGHSAPEIGRKLHISAGTVQGSLYSSCRKLGARNAAHAIVIALHPDFAELDFNSIEIPLYTRQPRGSIR